MQTLILTLHIIVCFLLVILILLQSGKEGMGVIFGGGNSTVFGSTGAGGILAKLTTLMAIIFVITSLSYTYVTSSHTTDESAVLNVQIEETVPDAAKEEAGAPSSAAGQPAAAQPSANATLPSTNATMPAPSAKPEAPATPEAPKPAPGAAKPAP